MIAFVSVVIPAQAGIQELPAKHMDSGSPLRYARNDKLALAKAGKGVIIYNKVTTAIFWGRETATASISLGASSLRERARGMKINTTSKQQERSGRSRRVEKTA